MTTTTVLYVGGTGRSGSTVFANLLGESPGFVSVGEVRFLWSRGLQENRLCGCGEHFKDCPYWREVLRTAYPGGAPSAQAVTRAIQDGTRMRYLGSYRVGSIQPKGLAEVLVPLYKAIAEVAGAEVVVDSSKLPTYAAILQTLPEMDVRMAHIVRDPRAAAFSWRRVKDLPDGGTRTVMERRGVLKSAALWSVWNNALERMWRNRPQAYHRVSYERLIASPEAELRALLRELALDGEPWAALTGPSTARVSVHHTVAGNPARLQRGSVTLHQDDEWVSAMRQRDRRLVEIMTAPTMRRYGYRRSTTSMEQSP